jgi:predicted Fe-Mo cluster-binding NifX family protein
MLYLLARGDLITLSAIFWELKITMPYRQVNLTTLMLFIALFLYSGNTAKHKAAAGTVEPQVQSDTQTAPVKAEDKDKIKYTRELVMEKAKDVFPKEDVSKIMSILDEYGVESYEQERERVQLAILKLSEGDMKELKESVKAAKQDYRDVLAYAEFPLEMKSETLKLDAEKAKEIREKDRKQYLEWLKRKPK